ADEDARRHEHRQPRDMPRADLNMRWRCGISCLPVRERARLPVGLFDAPIRDITNGIRLHLLTCRWGFDGVSCAGDYLDRRHEPVAATWDRLDKRWVIGGIAQRLTNFADGCVDAGLDVDEHILSPQPPDDLGARHEGTPPLHEHD